MPNLYGVDDNELREACIMFCRASRDRESCSCAKSDKNHYCESLAMPLMGLFRKSGVDTPKEVFYDNGLKEGSDMQFIATDMCIMISMCLQAGFTHKQIANSLSKFEGPMGDRHGSPVGIIVDELAKPPQWDLSVN